MRHINRRSFLNSMLGAGAGFAVGKSIAGQGPRVVLIGAGVGGLTAARHLAAHYPNLDLTMIEPNAAYTTCFSSGAVLAGLKDRVSLDFSYNAVRATKSLNWIKARATHIDAEKSLVHLSTSQTVPYDRLIVSPGIGLNFARIEGLDAAAQGRFPHSYVLGSEIDDLRKRLTALEDGALVVLSAPERPYRCTPAPYERASMIAHYLKTHKPKSKLLVLDSKDEFPLMDRILPAWERFYGDTIEWVPADFGGVIERVNGADGTIVVDGETLAPGLANIIPPQRAGDIAIAAGLTDDEGWCAVDPLTLESKKIANIHVIGDAANAGDMSKSAHAAASLGRNCANAVGHLLAGKKVPVETLENACYFLISKDHGLKVGGEYRAEKERITGVTGFSSAIGEPDATRQQTAEEGNNWYASFTHTLFE